MSPAIETYCKTENSAAIRKNHPFLLTPIFAIQTPIHYRLCNMILIDLCHAVKVGNCSCHTEHTVVTSCGETERFKSLLHQGGALLSGNTVLMKLFDRHSGIESAGLITACLKSLVGESSCRVDSLANFGRAFALLGFARDLVICNGRKLDFYINTVEKRTADSFKIFGYCTGCATALSCGIAKVTSLAGIHSADQHK